MTNFAFATEAQERIYLTQIVNSLNALQPLIVAAQQAQTPMSRVQFHYSRYRDTQGHWHNGLLDDVLLVKAGVLQQLNRSPIEPYHVVAVKGDYLTHNKIA